MPLMKIIMDRLYTNLFKPEFRLPLVVFGLLLLGFIPDLDIAWLAGAALGITKIFVDSFEKIRERNFSLDYIALLAMIVALVADEYLAGAVVALMITGGEALDEYASGRAENALRALLEKIPKECTVRHSDGTTTEVPIQQVRSGDVIVVRPNELIPLDGTLQSNDTLLNQANLTGEAFPVSFRKGAFIKSGAVNVGSTIEIAVEGTFETSTYMKIVRLVDQAKHSQPRMVKLADGRTGQQLTLLELADTEFKFHPAVLEDFSRSRYLDKILDRLAGNKPKNYEALVATEGVGPKTVRALALVGEVIYGAKPSYEDPARYSFAHGGKDATPYPVDRPTYDEVISILAAAVRRARWAPQEQDRALARLGQSASRGLPQLTPNEHAHH